MTQSVVSMFQYSNIWQILLVVILLSVVLFILLLVFPNISKIDENGKKIRKQKEYRPSMQERLISLAIGILLFCFIVIILILVLCAISTQLNVAVENCANCTIALNSG